MPIPFKPGIIGLASGITRATVMCLTGSWRESNQGFLLTYQLKNGEVQHSVSPLFGEDAKLAEEIIMSYCQSQLYGRVLILQLVRNVISAQLIVTAQYRLLYFLHEGKAVMQGGNEGVYNSIDINLYNRLIELINKHQSN